jgi:membrane-associated phospholipid phosphatase
LRDWLTELDDRGVAELVRLRETPLGRVAVVFSHLGRGGLVWVGLASIVGAGRRPLRRRDGVALTAAAVGSALASSALLARAVRRPRPCDRGVEPLIPCPEGGSLPSDQAAAAFAAAEVLAWLEPDARGWLCALAMLIAASRVVVGAHHPSDVVAGALLGKPLGRLSWAVAERR